MKQKRSYIYFLLIVFFCLLFCFLAKDGLHRLSGQTAAQQRFPVSESSTISAAGQQHQTMDFQRSKSLLGGRFSSEESSESVLKNFIQSFVFLFILVLPLLTVEQRKAGLFAFHKFQFLLIRYPVHIIETVHRKDGKKRIPAFF